jgi:DNA (cytosine-5)-methyltransferase 1
LTIRECARIQSFPDDYVFYGQLADKQQQVADAVPPLLAEEVAKHIKENLR